MGQARAFEEQVGADRLAGREGGESVRGEVRAEGLVGLGSRSFGFYSRSILESRYLSKLAT